MPTCRLPSLAPARGARARAALAASLLCACLSGCGKPAEPAPKLYAPEREALDRAKGLEDTVKQQAEDQRKKIEEQEKQ